MGIWCIVDRHHIAVPSTILYPDLKYEEGKEIGVTPNVQAGTLDHEEDTSLPS